MKKINAWWMKLIKPFLNERGIVGDYHKEEFDKEELEALGEEPAKVEDSKKTDEGAGKSQEELDAEAKAKADADKTVQDDSKTEHADNKPVLTTEEQAVADKEGVKLIEENGKQYLVDDDGAKIPVERWKKNYAKTQADIRTATQTAEETNRKLNLLKELGTDKYYEIYPDEKPANYQPPAAKTAEAAMQPVEDFNTMLVTGGKYDGWQLGDVAKEDPIAASLMLNNYLESKRAVVEQETKRKNDFEQSFAQERGQFCLERGKELFNKSDNFTDAEKAQIIGVYDDLSKWMIANKIPHYKMEDAYLLKNKDKIIQLFYFHSMKRDFAL